MNRSQSRQREKDLARKEITEELDELERARAELCRALNESFQESFRREAGPALLRAME